MLGINIEEWVCVNFPKSLRKVRRVLGGRLRVNRGDKEAFFSG